MRQKSYINISQFFFLLLFWCVSPWLGVGQERNIKFENISVQDGLSNNFVNCIIQDSLGFIWIGTKDGLNRYDGYNFKKYNVKASDSTSISNNFVNAICEDPTHRGLWVGTNEGLNFFDFKTEQFSRCSYSGTNKKIPIVRPAYPFISK